MNKPTIALITDEYGIYSGGRYYIHQVIKAINQLDYNLIVIINKDQPSKEDFKDYGSHQQIIFKDISKVDIEADLYIGTPQAGASMAMKLGKKYVKPSMVMVFDSLPLLKKYYPKDVETEITVKESFFEQIEESDTNLLVLAEANRTSILEDGWLNKREDQIFSLSPCVNEKVMKQVPEQEKEDIIIMTSRMVPRKNFPQAITVLKGLDKKYKLYIISNNLSPEVENTIRSFNLQDRIKLFSHITDLEKFELLKKSKAAINTSFFEGFGMFITEARACGVPIVVNDFPVFREIKKKSKDDGIYLAKRNDDFDFTKILRKALNKEHKPVNYYNFNRFKKEVKDILECLTWHG